MVRKVSTRETVGKAIRILRDRRGYSQEGLGDRAGLHRTYVGQVERGERNPSFESLDRLIKALGANWSQFGELIDGSASAKDSIVTTSIKKTR